MILSYTCHARKPSAHVRFRLQDLTRTSFAGPVVVSLYGESGCPDTTGFIFSQLVAVEEAVRQAVACALVVSNNLRVDSPLDFDPQDLSLRARNFHDIPQVSLRRQDTRVCSNGQKMV